MSELEQCRPLCYGVGALSDRQRSVLSMRPIGKAWDVGRWTQRMLCSEYFDHMADKDKVLLSKGLYHSGPEMRREANGGGLVHAQGCLRK
jgi:hypothetical protein